MNTPETELHVVRPENPVSAAPAALAVAPAGAPVGTAAQNTAPKLNAIQRIEQELITFMRQREQAVANVHAIDGAIQAAQHIVAVLKGEEAKAATAVEGEAAKR
jgi:hypothetical protein